MNQRGQFWTLDVILAAVIFTLALGLIIGQAEKRVYFSQENERAEDIERIALLSSAAATMHPQFVVATCQKFINQGLPCECTGAFCLPDSDGWVENLRCGPNATKKPPYNNFTPLTLFGWVSDFDISPIPHCMIDQKAPARLSVLELSNEYSWRMDSPTYTFKLVFEPLPKNSAYYSIKRHMLLYATQMGPLEFRKCLDGGCASDLHDVVITVWRK